MNIVNLINRALAKLGYRLARLQETPETPAYMGNPENERYLRDRNAELIRKLGCQTTQKHYWRKQCEKMRARKERS